MPFGCLSLRLGFLVSFKNIQIVVLSVGCARGWFGWRLARREINCVIQPSNFFLVSSVVWLSEATVEINLWEVPWGVCDSRFGGGGLVSFNKKWSVNQIGWLGSNDSLVINQWHFLRTIHLSLPKTTTPQALLCVEHHLSGTPFICQCNHSHCFWLYLRNSLE